MPKEKNSVVSIAGLVKKKNAPIINHIITIPATIVRKVFLDILYSLCIYIREVQMKVAEVLGGRVGFEPTTCCLKDSCSTTELPAQNSMS